jgi:hypothetical protein
MLARGAGIVAVRPIMGEAFSRRALYRHREKHMIHAPSPAARPVAFPHAGSPLQKLKWLEREVEHTAALAEHRGELGTKLKALYLLSRLLWLEARLTRGALDVTPDHTEAQYKKAAITPTDEREEEIIRLFQNRTYRKKDEETPGEPSSTDCS